MNKLFSELLNEYLDSECEDYSMSYKSEWSEDMNCCIVTIKCNYNDNYKDVNFRFNDDKKQLSIELSEDSWYETSEYEYTVKYFWMLVAPALFPENN
jgi:hypothetical protein